MGEKVTNKSESAAYRSGAAREFIEGRLRLGVVAFPLAEFQKESKLSPLASRRQLERLGPWILKLPRKDFYLIVGPEHRTVGVPPPLWWLHDYFRWLQHSYYLALQSAAAAYGSEPQALQVVQVMTEHQLKDLELGRVIIRFFFKRTAVRTPTQMADQSRAPLRISTPAATVLDLMRYSSRIGGLARVWDTFVPLLPQIHTSDLRKALEAEDESALGQRLGYLLERAGNERLAGTVQTWLTAAPQWTLLEPGAPDKSGPRVERWRVYKNTKL